MEHFKEIRREHFKSEHIECIVYEHIETKSPIVKMLANDTNKSFMITFNTPIESDNGVCHIIEHSVLAGSEKYTTKEPFADLMKGSLQNFLNAMTGDDHTMYPIASVNDKDYLNLMSVYLDGVFCPRVRKDPYAFYQEGHRWEIDEDGELIQNGIVYNEMRETETSATTIIRRYVRNKLFNGTYQFECGGMPKTIESLTYEQFCKFYDDHYHPSNCITCLYSPMNLIEKEFELLHSYFKGKGQKERYYPVVNENNYFGKKDVVEFPIEDDEDDEKKDIFGYFWRLDHLNCQEKFTLELIRRLLVGVEGAPLDEKLKKLGICTKATSYFNDEMENCVLGIFARDADPERFDEFITVVEEELKKYVKEGFDHDRILGMLNSEEFNLRECNFGSYPKGVVYAMNISAANAKGHDIFENFHTDEELKVMREGLPNNYFEQMAEKFLINNEKRIFIKGQPKKGLVQQWEDEATQRWKEATKDFDENKKNEIMEMNKELKRRQQEPDTPEQLATIPKLTLEDIGEDPLKIKLDKIENDFPMYRQIASTNGIVYFRYLFDISDLTIEELDITSIIASTMKSFNTKNSTFLQLGGLIDLYFGKLTFTTIAQTDNHIGVTPEEHKKFKYQFAITGKALYQYIEEGMKVLGDMMQNIIFDREIFEKKFKQFGLSIENSIKTQPTSSILSRLQSYYSTTGIITDVLGGIDSYLNSKRVLSDFDKYGPELLTKVEQIYKKIFHKSRLQCFYCVDEENDKDIFPKLQKITEYLSGEPLGTPQTYPEPTIKNEAIQLPVKTNVVAQGYDYINMGYSYNGAYKVLLEIIEKDYLWNKVRIEGGAYGCYVVYNQCGGTIFASFGDPKLYETYDVYNRVEEYINNLDLTQEEIETYLIGIFADFDRPSTVESDFRFVMSVYFNNEVENRARIRKEMLEVTNEKLKEAGKIILEGMKKNMICASANSESIAKKDGVFSSVLNVLAKEN